MCGFSFCISHSKDSFKDVKLMNSKILHRGPDKEKFINSKSLKKFKNHNTIKFCAGFRRLKIIDLSNKANQPMFYNERYLIVFNGEIYNFIELKKILIKKNYKFKTKSDTEVILAAYDCWGKKCFNLFNGMWSLIIYDLKKNKLIACRDRYGVKPLYYKKIEDSYYFASEVKQLMILNKENVINKNTLSNYLFHDLISLNEKTFIENIFQVKPGHYIEYDVNKSNFKKRKWYLFKERKLNSKDKLSKIFTNSIKIRLRSDVKVGISLSGGIDSSTIASIVANLKKESFQKIYTFSSRSNDKNDEYEYVKEFNKMYNFKNVPIDLKFTNFKKDFLKLVKQHDYPISNLSIFSEWEVFKKMKSKKITVNIDGHGADEQLCGYENYFSLYLLECFKNLKFFELIKFLKDLVFLNIRNKFSFISKIFINLFPTSFLDFFKYISNQKIKKKWIKLKFKSQPQYKFKKSLVINQNFIQFFFTSLPKQLNWSDINSMSHSIETRSPFLDYNFVESVLPLKMEKKISGVKSKYILRETFKSLIPKKIYERNFKIGFLAPGEAWTKQNSKHIEKMFNYYFNYLKSLISSDCKNYAIDIIRGKSKYKEWIWKLIFLGAWIKYHKVKL